MAKNKMTLHFKGFEEYIKRLDELGNETAMKRGVESALRVSKQYVTSQINAAMAQGNLPAKGKYSTGRTKQSINTDMVVEWKGLTGSIDVGFDFEKSGMTSIYLMYGTPKMSPVKGLKNAIYGTKTKKEIGKIQEETLIKVIKRVMEN